MAMEYRQSLNCIYQYSEKMLEAARLNHWDEVIALQSTRDESLNKLSNISPEAMDLTLAEMLEQILKINAEIQMLSRQQLQQFSTKHTELRKSRLAMTAYRR